MSSKKSRANVSDVDENLSQVKESTSNKVHPHYKNLGNKQ